MSTHAQSLRLMLDFNHSAMQAGRIVRSILSSKHVCLYRCWYYWNFSQFFWTHKVHYKLLQRKLQNFDDGGLLSGWSFVWVAFCQGLAFWVVFCPVVFCPIVFCPYTTEQSEKLYSKTLHKYNTVPQNAFMWSINSGKEGPLLCRADCYATVHIYAYIYNPKK